MSKKPSEKIIQPGVYNTLHSAPTRRGKGLSNVIPTLFSYGKGMTILDFMTTPASGGGKAARR